jgi:hypothetical protein
MSLYNDAVSRKWFRGAEKLAVEIFVGSSFLFKSVQQAASILSGVLREPATLRREAGVYEIKWRSGY